MVIENAPKSYYAKGNCPWYHAPHVRGLTNSKKIIEEGVTYRAEFRYENFCSRAEMMARKTADYADWVDHVKMTVNAKKQINQSNKSGEEKKQQRDKLDAQEVDLNKGQFNKILQRVKDIETNVQKTIPEKVKDMKEIMEEIDKKNEEVFASLEDKENSLQDTINKLAVEYTKKTKEGNKSGAILTKAQIQKAEETMKEITEAKENFKNGKWIQDFVKGMREENSKWFFQKIDWKNPYTYAKLSLLVIILVVLVALIIWIINKIKGFFVPNR